jgi:trigger factor
MRPEGKPLSSTSTVENNPLPEAAGAAREPDPEGHPSHGGHEGEASEGETGASHPPEGHEPEGHEHDGHEHGAHQHGPVLNPECTRELVVEASAEEVSKAYRRVTANYRKYARIPGFRPGKVPESVIRRKFAAEIRKDVIDALLPDRFNQAVRELGARPVGQPQVTDLKVEDGAPLVAKAVFEVLPSFSIEGYKSVTVEKPSVEVTEEEFAREMEQLRESRVTFEPVEEERALQDGDWAQIRYKGTIEAEGADPVDRATDKDPSSETPIEGEDSLVEVGGKDTVEALSSVLRGALAGQELKAEVVYPAEYGEPRLKGKTVAYELEVKGIKKRTVPELDDDFAREMGEYENYADLAGKVREHMAGRKKRAVETETKDRLLAALAGRFPFPVPESLVQEQVDARLERGLRALAAQGMSAEQMRKMDFTRLRGAQREGALAEVKAGMVLDRIAGEEKLEVSDEELDRELQVVAMQAREPLDTLKVRLTQEGGLARIREQLRREKTANLLYERLPG